MISLSSTKTTTVVFIVSIFLLFFSMYGIAWGAVVFEPSTCGAWTNTYGTTYCQDGVISFDTGVRGQGYFYDIGLADTTTYYVSFTVNGTGSCGVAPYSGGTGYCLESLDYEESVVDAEFTTGSGQTDYFMFDNYHYLDAAVGTVTEISNVCISENPDECVLPEPTETPSESPTLVIPILEDTMKQNTSDSLLGILSENVWTFSATFVFFALMVKLMISSASRA